MYGMKDQELRFCGTLVLPDRLLPDGRALASSVEGMDHTAPARLISHARIGRVDARLALHDNRGPGDGGFLTAGNSRDRLHLCDLLVTGRRKTSRLSNGPLWIVFRSRVFLFFGWANRAGTDQQAFACRRFQNERSRAAWSSSRAASNPPIIRNVGALRARDGSGLWNSNTE